MDTVRRVQETPVPSAYDDDKRIGELQKTKRLIFIAGTGRCGFSSCRKLLNEHGPVNIKDHHSAMLPWQLLQDSPLVRDRVRHLLSSEPGLIVGDTGSYYLPHAEKILQAYPESRVVILKRDQEKTVRSFCRWLDRTGPLRYDHWSRVLPLGWHRHPVWSHVYPTYEASSREDAIAQYWAEYYEIATKLRENNYDRVRVFDTEETLNSDQGIASLLDFVGIPAEHQKTSLRFYEASSENAAPVPVRAPRPSPHPNDPRRCVVLVPFGAPILPAVDEALRELERRGYVVRRVGGYAAIDQARNQLSSDALIDGFEETMWIDSDVVFHPDAVDQLRAHRQPITCGIYPQKGRRALACHILPGSPGIRFGEHGGLTEILYAGTGFLHIRREVYMAIQEQLRLPVCNERFGVPLLPFFQPMNVQLEGGHWYLAEDYAFCQRARDCGFKIYADTSVRLWHVGQYHYGWEDAGRSPERYESFGLNFPEQPKNGKAK